VTSLLEREKYQMQRRIACRTRYLRGKLDLNQNELASALGLPSGKAISSIETGERDVSSEELVRFAEYFNQSIDFFTDPTLLIGESRFSWRAKAESKTLIDFEAKASRWIGAWREAGRFQEDRFKPFTKAVPLDENSTFEESWEAAEQIVKAWRLGSYPAEKLAEKAELELDLLVLFIDAPRGISGAACWIKEFGTVLINRQESEGRRNFDLAHELFHLLTWQAMPPEYIDPANTNGKKPRVEVLADNFAGALLMPESSVRAVYAERRRADLKDWLVEICPIFRVSAQALYWRLVALRIINNNCAKEIEALRWNKSENTVNHAFSRKFIARIYEAVERGQMSFSFIAKLFGMSREELKNLFSSYFPHAETA
jgi:XRE family transcriptional regulator, fatty acid utilization regulator